MTRRIHEPNGLCQIRTGEPATEQRNFPKAFDHGIVEIRSGGVWQRHPDFPRTYQEFDIELTSDVIGYIFRSHLSCYTGKSSFCNRAHRGNDSVGIAQRRTAGGGLFQTECDPSRCALYQNYEEANSRTSELLKVWGEVYPYVDFKTKTGAAMCKPYNFLLFALLKPDGTYAHPRGEFCQLVTHSNTNHSRFMDKLRDLAVECNGKLAGLRLKLCFEPFTSRMGKSTPAWALRVPEDTDFERQRVQATQRRMLKTMDYEALAGVDSTALVKIDADQNVALSVAADYPEVMRGEVRTQEHIEQASADWIDPATVELIQHHPLVRLLIDRVGIPYAKETALPRDYGKDVRRCVAWLKERAEAKDINVDDLLADYGYLTDAGARETPPVAAQESQPAPESASDEPEFTEVPDEPSDATIEAAVRGQTSESVIGDACAEEMDVALREGVSRIAEESATDEEVHAEIDREHERSMREMDAEDDPEYLRAIEEAEKGL